MFLARISRFHSLVVIKYGKDRDIKDSITEEAFKDNSFQWKAIQAKTSLSSLTIFIYTLLTRDTESDRINCTPVR